MLAGVYIAYKKDKTLYYRSSITYKNKHISLGSFAEELTAHNAYLEATNILSDNTINIEQYNKKKLLSFDKWVSLINFRDNGIYFKNPIQYNFSFYATRILGAIRWGFKQFR